MTLAKGPLITLGEIRPAQVPDPGGGGACPTLAELEARYIRQVLEEVGGDKQAAAQILGISLRTLQRRVKELS